MTSLWTNRILVVLGLLALFISTTLLISHFFNLELPCTDTQGCATVERSHWSMFLGVPTAAYGMAFDLFVIAVCLIRPGRSDRFWRLSSLALGCLGLAAMVVSGLLILNSITDVKAICEWCVAHAITVGALAIVACAEYSAMPREDATFPPSRERVCLAIPLVLGILATTSYGVYLKQAAPHNGYRPQPYRSSMMGTHPWSRGPENAPVTIVEFGDYECPTCAKAAGRITELMNSHPGKVRHIFRNYVIWQRHPRAWEIAEIAEWAGTKGKFWPIYEALTSDQEPAVNGEYDGYAKAVGIDPKELDKYVASDRADKGGPRYAAFMRVLADQNDARSLDVNATPTFFVILKEPGRKAQTPLRAESIGGLKSILESADVSRLLGK